MEKRLEEGHNPFCTVLWIGANLHQTGTLPLLHDKKAEISQEEIGPTEDVSNRGEERYDELYARAIIIVLLEGRGSVSMLQRFLGIGYGRAARLIDFMFEDGIVGPHNGSNARDVLFSRVE